MEKQKIIDALYKFIAQRSGMDYSNYNDVKSFRAEQRTITRDGQQAKRLVRDIELRDSITADDIVNASKSGRLAITQADDGAVALDYCTGQYFPTEYRRAVCAVAATALWHWKRDYCMPTGTLMHNQETGETLYRYRGMRQGDYLRASFMREYGRAIATRWFS